MSDILLVDDERWVRTALRKVIERCGEPFRVVKECSNGLEALDWLNGNEADVVMTDVRMPVMDGISLVKRLRERPERPEVVMVSGHDDFVYVQFALRAQAADYLLKPVEADEMSRCLKDVTRRLSGPRLQAAEMDEAKAKLELSAIDQVVRYIHSALPGEITLQEAAAIVHLNPSYLSQLFKQRMKQTFVDYVIEQRMDRAKRLLSETSLRISEVAERVGYADLAYFSNAFKRTVGKTPREYRRDGA